MITIDKWEMNIERGMEQCTPSSSICDSPCVYCGKIVPAMCTAVHSNGFVTFTVEFETRDEIPKDINLRMFGPEFPDVSATVVRHTPQPGTRRCIATCVQREEVRA